MYVQASSRTFDVDGSLKNGEENVKFGDDALKVIDPQELGPSEEYPPKERM